MTKQSTTNEAGHRHRHRGLLIALLIVVVVAGIIAIALQPIVRWATRHELNQVQEFAFDFEDVHLSIIPLEYGISHFKVSARDQPKAPPLAYLDTIRVGLNWRQLVRGHIVANVRVDKAKISMVEERANKEPAKKALSLGDTLQKLSPLEMDRLEVKESEVLYVLGTDKGSPSIWMHNIEATVENLATRAHLTAGTTTLALRATVQRSAELTAFVTADPLAKNFTFSGRAKLAGLQAKELAELSKSKADIEPVAGHIDVVAQFDAREGVLSGGVEPIIKNLKLAPSKDDLGTKLKAILADAAVKILSDRVPGRNAVSTVIPIHGDLKNPKLELWPTILGVLRNAFVEGISESFQNVPPPQAGAPETPLTQARRALSKHGGIPHAQPTAEKKP